MLLFRPSFRLSPSLPLSHLISPISIRNHGSVGGTDLKGLVTQIRQRTGAGVMDCKKALEAANMDVESAVASLVEKAQASGVRAGRMQNAGSLGIGISADHKKASIIELSSETDFVSLNPNFQAALPIINTAALSLYEKMHQSAVVDGPQEVVFIGLEPKEVIEGNADAQKIVAELIFSMKENIILRRSSVLSISTPNGSSAIVGGYIHGQGRVGALVAITAPTSSQPPLIDLANKLAVHVAACNPRAINQHHAKSKEIGAAESELLVHQDFIMDSLTTVQQLLDRSQATVHFFVRWERGDVV